MTELDDLAEALATVVVRIIAVPLQIVRLVLKVGRRKYQKALRHLRTQSEKRLQRRVARLDRQKPKPKRNTLDKFKLYFEDLPSMVKIKRNRKKNGRSIHK